MKTKKLIITIDGPAGAGKSTVAKKLAAKLNYIYLDTGAMFRAIAWLAQEKGFDLQKDQKEIGSLCEKINFEYIPSPKGIKIYLDGKEVTPYLRSPVMDKASSLVAIIPEVRECLLKKQRALGSSGGIVAEGRDMGSVVFPEADLKFFLTASPEIRAQRRYKELQKQGKKVKLETILKEIVYRDEQDKNRSQAPLVVPKDAVIVDTTHRDIEEVIEILLEEINKIISRKN